MCFTFRFYFVEHRTSSTGGSAALITWSDVNAGGRTGYYGNTVLADCTPLTSSWTDAGCSAGQSIVLDVGTEATAGDRQITVSVAVGTGGALAVTVVASTTLAPTVSPAPSLNTLAPTTDTCGSGNNATSGCCDAIQFPSTGKYANRVFVRYRPTCCSSYCSYVNTELLKYLTYATGWGYGPYFTTSDPDPCGPLYVSGSGTISFYNHFTVAQVNAMCIPAPTMHPIPAPTNVPLSLPTTVPFPSPTKAPVLAPTNGPSTVPLPSPTKAPVLAPTNGPVPLPTTDPIPAPTKIPIPAPTVVPIPSPTKVPTQCLRTSPDVVLLGGSYMGPNKAVQGAYTHAGFDYNGKPYFTYRVYYLYQAPGKPWRWNVGTSAMGASAYGYFQDVVDVDFPTDFSAAASSFVYNGVDSFVETTTELDLYCPSSFCSSMTFNGGYAGGKSAFVNDGLVYKYVAYHNNVPYYSSASGRNLYYRPDYRLWVLSNQPVGTDDIDWYSSTVWPGTAGEVWLVYDSGAAAYVEAVPAQFISCITSGAPTQVPAPAPSERPVPAPTSVPMPAPTMVPMSAPTNVPVPLPTNVPVPLPTNVPAPLPTTIPIPAPTSVPVPLPTQVPAPAPSETPVLAPTSVPMPAPTMVPMSAPTMVPMSAPTNVPAPTFVPILVPTKVSVPVPTPRTMLVPTPRPTLAPSVAPTEADTVTLRVVIAMAGPTWWGAAVISCF